MRIVTAGTTYFPLVQRQRVIWREHRNINSVFAGGNTFGMAVGAEGGQWFDEIIGAGRGGVVAVSTCMVSGAGIASEA